ncbi:MAG: HlyD family efflux transporter periplasmic adaptor subunit [Chloroflexi bacterium]|nr:HlyD family efflux transporter periplasmic adaptor subunit [Chloroflexota bacterium]
MGDVVEAGQLLAQLDDTTEQIKYAQAKRNLLELTSPASVAEAEQAVALAQQGLGDARDHLAYLISPAVLASEEKVAEAEQALLDAQAEAEANPSDDAQKKVAEAEAALASAQRTLAGNQAYYETNYIPDNFTVKETDRQTKTTTKYVSAPSEIDIAEARAAYALAEAKLSEAQYYLAALTGGDVPEDATGSGLTKLEQAQLDLQAAQDNLDAKRLYAPISGTVITINAGVGDTVGTSPIITVSDLSEPYLEIFLDETDWDKIAPDYDVEVIFDALPEKVFTGTVTQVDPALYTEQGASLVRGLVRLDGQSIVVGSLPVGSNAAVDVIGGRAEKVILVPIEALHETSPGNYTVFVLEDGEPKLRIVEVGLKDLFYAEIKSGLKVGELVTTGIVETK